MNDFDVISYKDTIKTRPKKYNDFRDWFIEEAEKQIPAERSVLAILYIEGRKVGESHLPLNFCSVDFDIELKINHVCEINNLQLHVTEMDLFFNTKVNNGCNRLRKSDSATLNLSFTLD